MKRLSVLFPISFAILLLIFPEISYEAASEALSLFTARVFPALFPFYVVVTLGMEHAPDVKEQPLKRTLTIWRTLPRFVIGATAGYPTGARVAAPIGGDRLAACCNLCSPVFLYSVVCLSFLGESGYFAPLAVAHYGAALLCLLIDRIVGGKRSATVAPVRAPLQTQQTNLLQAIGDGMLAMLKICGCIVFFSVVARLLTQLMPGDESGFVSAWIAVALEMTNGCSVVAGLPLDMRTKLACLAFCVSFGGGCILAQTVMVARIERPLVYMLLKTSQAFLSAALAYLTAPLLVPTAFPICAPLPSVATMGRNAVATGSLLLVCAIGMLASYLLAAIIKQAGGKSPARNTMLTL